MLQCLTIFLVVMNKLDKIIAIFLLKIWIMISGIALSILSVVLFDVHVGIAIAFVGIILTVLALDSSKLVS